MIKNYFYLFIFIILIFNGCATRTIYQPTNIPVKCDIDLPKRPTKHNNEVENIKNLLIYTELLEVNLKFCTNN